MTIRIAGEQDKHQLDFAARNIYTLPNDEYRVLPSSLKDGDYILEIKTIRIIVCGNTITCECLSIQV